MNKTKINYWMDLTITVAFVASAISGLVFLLPVTGSSAVGLPYRFWSQLHTWGSILMLVGVVGHLALHWKWIVCMTKKNFAFVARSNRELVCESGTMSSRREFMRTAGVSAIAVGAGALGMRLYMENQLAHASDMAGQTAPVAPVDEAALSGVAVENGAAAQPAVDAPIVEPQLPTVTPTTAVEEHALAEMSPTATPQNAASSAQASTAQSSSRGNTRSSQTASVMCPKGLVYDAYPGQCRHYVDRDGDGYCDLSIPV